MLLRCVDVGCSRKLCEYLVSLICEVLHRNLSKPALAGLKLERIVADNGREPGVRLLHVNPLQAPLHGAGCWCAAHSPLLESCFLSAGGRCTAFCRPALSSAQSLFLSGVHRPPRLPSDTALRHDSVGRTASRQGCCNGFQRFTKLLPGSGDGTEAGQQSLSLLHFGRLAAAHAGLCGLCRAGEPGDAATGAGGGGARRWHGDPAGSGLPQRASAHPCHAGLPPRVRE